jgi:hypothetical protein
MLWLTRISQDSSYLADIVGPIVIFGLGAGMAFLPLTSTALAGVPSEDAGAASGLVNVMQQVGGALGLAILVTVFGTASRNEAGHSLPGLSALARQHHDLAHAVASSFIASAIFAVATFVVIVSSVRSRPARA